MNTKTIEMLTAAGLDPAAFSRPLAGMKVSETDISVSAPPRPALSPDRIGKITASQFHRIGYAKNGTDWSEEAESYLGELIWEHITGETASKFAGSPATDWGHQHESEAIRIFEEKKGLKVIRNKFVKLKGSQLIGGTPDGIGEGFFAEAKSPYTPKNHFKTYLNATVPKEYELQVTGQALLTALDIGYYISYDPRLPQKYGHIIIPYEAEKGKIDALKSRLFHFEETLFERLRRLEIEPRV